MHARLAFGILLVFGLADLAWLDLHLAPQLALTQAREPLLPAGTPDPILTGAPSVKTAPAGPSASAPPTVTSGPTPAPPVPVPSPPEPVPTTVGETLVNVPFDLDSHQVNYLPSLVILRELAAELARDPSKQLRVRGHSDQMGSSAHKVRLSRSRAMSVQAYLIAHGAPADRISIEAVGASEPIDPGSNPIAWAKNRRVQVVWR